MSEAHDENADLTEPYLVARPPGYYWVKDCGRWKIARCSNMGIWSLCGSDIWEYEHYFAEIGPRLTPPGE